jgi:hypothetical protein
MSAVRPQTWSGHRGRITFLNLESLFRACASPGRCVNAARCCPAIITHPLFVSAPHFLFEESPIFASVFLPFCLVSLLYHIFHEKFETENLRKIFFKKEKHKYFYIFSSFFLPKKKNTTTLSFSISCLQATLIYSPVTFRKHPVRDSGAPRFI